MKHIRGWQSWVLNTLVDSAGPVSNHCRCPPSSPPLSGSKSLLKIIHITLAILREHPPSANSLNRQFPTIKLESFCQSQLHRCFLLRSLLKVTNRHCKTWDAPNKDCMNRFRACICCEAPCCESQCVWVSSAIYELGESNTAGRRPLRHLSTLPIDTISF